jgi:hypothetical protein
MAKERSAIPKEVAAKVLFLSDRTCCVCKERGKEVQIHHIDENPHNHLMSNLAVLCFDCHNLTMIKGGFGRKLDAAQVILYRNDFQEMVSIKREKFTEIASIDSIVDKADLEPPLQIKGDVDYFGLNHEINSDVLETYLIRIIQIHKLQKQICQVKWDSGVTSVMNQGNYDMVSFYEEVITELISFYPKNHFCDGFVNEYLSEYISSRFAWHRKLLEPHGGGSGGTMITTTVGSSVLHELSDSIIDMVNALTNYETAWKQDWESAFKE